MLKPFNSEASVIAVMDQFLDRIDKRAQTEADIEALQSEARPALESAKAKAADFVARLPAIRAAQAQRGSSMVACEAAIRQAIVAAEAELSNFDRLVELSPEATDRARRDLERDQLRELRSVLTTATKLFDTLRAACASDDRVLAEIR
ncbi:MAG: hypothetical protein ACKVOX_05710 [Rhizobacter sp.]